MNISIIRKSLLYIFIAFLVLTALLAVIAVLMGEFGDFQQKILATTLSISTASICAMSCASYVEKKKHKWLGLLGIGLSVSAVTLVNIGLWSELDFENFWKSTLTIVILAIAVAHGCLLAGPKLNRQHTWVQSITSVSIALLTTLIIIAVWNSDVHQDRYFRLLAVVAIAVALLTLIIPYL